MSLIAALLAKIAAKRGEPVNVVLARAMHNRHCVSGPPYDQKSEGFQQWMIEQADAAIKELLDAEIDTEEY